MPHISKREVSPKIAKKIRVSFIKLFQEIGKTDEFFDQFFTDTEKVMFAKRLAIIAMLDKRVSQYKVSQELEVSSSTIDRMYRRLVSGQYDDVKQALREKVLRKTLFDHLETIIQPKFMRGLRRQNEKWLDEIYGDSIELRKKGYFEN